jgi:mitochondrial fission protein ELM1
MDKKALIISDGKPGHIQQSIAFCKLKKIPYDLMEFQATKVQKFFYYIFAFFGYFPKIKIEKNYDVIVSAGSSTYYANLALAKNTHAKSVAIMLPQGFKYSLFDYIIANAHDNPPTLHNIISFPLSLSIASPQRIVKKNKDQCIGVVIGGPNDIFSMHAEDIKAVLDDINIRYQDVQIVLTTSRRTPKEVELLIQQYDFDYSLIYSKEPNINPIDDFIAICDEIYVSCDSISMLSHIKANSKAKVHIIHLPSTTNKSKYHTFIDILGNLKEDVDLETLLQKAQV